MRGVEGVGRVCVAGRAQHPKGGEFSRDEVRSLGREWYGVGARKPPLQHAPPRHLMCRAEAVAA